jgi:hypothetical protein
VYSTLATLLDRLDRPDLRATNVMSWAAPIPAFGDVSTSTIATVGLNPSNREFLDRRGAVLEGRQRRFHTLESLRISSWAEADARHIRLMLDSCIRYFALNPYDIWFKRLDQLIARTAFSFYGSGACHLDLIPYATSEKWTDLDAWERSALLAVAADALASLLRNSPIRVLILNGRTVVKRFEEMTGTRLREREMRSWSLPRRSGLDVPGFSYKGWIEELHGVIFAQPVLVLGYNHNIQSSYGVTNFVMRAIGQWIALQIERQLVE